MEWQNSAFCPTNDISQFSPFEFNTLRKVNASVAVTSSHSLVLHILARYLQQLSLVLAHLRTIGDSGRTSFSESNRHGVLFKEGLQADRPPDRANCRDFCPPATWVLCLCGINDGPEANSTPRCPWRGWLREKVSTQRDNCLATLLLSRDERESFISEYYTVLLNDKHCSLNLKA